MLAIYDLVETRASVRTLITQKYDVSIWVFSSDTLPALKVLNKIRLLCTHNFCYGGVEDRSQAEVYCT